jgi:putative heme-binding domain-containing protein
LSCTPDCDRLEQYAANDKGPVHLRANAIRLLAHLNGARCGAVVRDLLGESTAPELQAAALRAAREHAGQWMHTILSNWPALSPTVRRAAIDNMLGRKNTIDHFVAKLVAGDIPATDLDATDAQRLLSVCSETDRAPLQRLFDRPGSSDRQHAIDDYRPATTMAGDRTRGAALFTKQCMACHSVQGRGQRIGPDLASVAGRPFDRLLVDILDPSREVGSESYNYVVVTKDGQIVSGLLSSETERAITLRRAEGVEDTVPRDRVQELRNTGRSLMPDGFERTLARQDVADLLEFLRHGEPPQE